MINLPSVHSSKFGIIFGGGCGENILNDTIHNITPDQYPEFYLLGANTDAMVHQSYFAPEAVDERLELWIKSTRLSIHQLGGETVTKGRGAGGSPEVGRQAAETEESLRVITSFIQSVDELMLVGASGGGTGTGFLPVAARIARELNKTTLAVTVLPHPRERRNKKAIAGLQQIRGLVPTIAIHNSYLDEYKKMMPKGQSQDLGFRDAWRLVNEHSIVPLLLTFREIIQVPGDVKNLDQADVRTGLDHGNYVLFGLARAPKGEGTSISAKEMTDQLLAAYFQDPGLVEQGLCALLWVHGPIPEGVVFDSMDIINQRMSQNDPANADELEIHWGMREEVTDDERWMALFIVAKEESVAKASVIDVIGVEESKPQKDPISLRTINHRLPREIRTADGGVYTVGLISEMAGRYDLYMLGRLTPVQAEVLCDQIEKMTGHRPELLDKYKRSKLTAV